MNQDETRLGNMGQRVIIIGVMAIPVGITACLFFGPLILFYSFFAGLGLVCCGIFINMMGVAQIRLIELIILISILGSTGGLIWRYVHDLHLETQDLEFLLFLLLHLVSIIFVLGCANSGLRLIKALRVDPQEERFKIIVLCVLKPIALLAIPAASIVMLAMATSFIESFAGGRPEQFVVEKTFFAALALAGAIAVLRTLRNLESRAGQLESERVATLVAADSSVQKS